MPNMLKWIKRPVILVAGSIVLLVGLLILPLPGPFGTPVILLGLAVLGSEFQFARNWRERFFKWVKGRRGKGKSGG